MADAIARESSSALPKNPDPPITRYVTLPDNVSVAYIAEISRASVDTITTLMKEMHLGLVSRCVDFQVAAKILRKFGIVSKRSSDA